MQLAQIGPYPIRGILGEGAMGRVYSAEHPELGEVAVKMMTAGKKATVKQRERFRREVGILQKLRHPHLVRLIDTGEHDGIPWLAMECVRGGTLEDRLQRGVLELDDALSLTIKLCGALQTAHDQGVLHRDLKPENVMLTESGEPVLTDFGLAKDLEAVESVKLSKTGGLTGTPGYWAPELAAGEREHVGPWTDTYGLGAVLYRMLTGQPPVMGNTLLECVLATLNQPPAAPSTLRAGLPAEVEALLLKSLEKDRASRFPNAKAMEAALRRARRASGAGAGASGARAASIVATLVAIAAVAWGLASLDDSGSNSRGKALFARASAAYKADDYEAAAALFHQAADAGEIRAMKNLGVLYSKGRGVEQDEAQALEWFRRAAEAGNPDAMNALGLRLQEGRGTERDPAQAYVWFERGAQAGSPRAMANVGLMTLRGQGVDADPTRALKWLERAAAQGNANALNGLGIAYSEGLGVDADDAAAVSWYRKAAAKGDRSAMNSLGVLHASGRGVAQSEVQAVAWYRKAAKAGDPGGQFNLGWAYLEGSGGLPSDPAQAVSWLRRAADRDHAPALLALGNLHRRGQGVPKNETRARALFELAAEAGSAPAMHNVGLLCEESGQSREALSWYRRAVKAGHEPSAAAVTRLAPN